MIAEYWDFHRPDFHLAHFKTHSNVPNPNTNHCYYPSFLPFLFFKYVKLCHQHKLQVTSSRMRVISPRHFNQLGLDTDSRASLPTDVQTNEQNHHRKCRHSLPGSKDRRFPHRYSNILVTRFLHHSKALGHHRVVDLFGWQLVSREMSIVNVPCMTSHVQ